MWTATILSKSLNKVGRSIYVNIEFSNGTDTFNNQFTFPLYTTIDSMKRVIKEYIEELEAGETLADTISTGILDTTSVVTQPTVDEVGFREWMKKKIKLEKVQGLVDLGVLTGTEQQVVTFRQEVKNGFKISFLALM